MSTSAFSFSRPVPAAEQLVGKGLVKQAGHRAGAAFGDRGLEQVIGGW
jgi:hypothetical protein